MLAAKILMYYLYKRGKSNLVQCKLYYSHQPLQIGGQWWQTTTGPLQYYINDVVYVLCWINIAVTVNSYYNIIATTVCHLSLSSFMFSYLIQLL